MYTNQPDALSGELPDLLSYLEATYREETQQEADKQLDFASFIEWSRKHLTEVRPSEVFPVDNNYGVLLTNSQRIQLCPNVTSEPQRTGGDMANPDTSISVSRLK